MIRKIFSQFLSILFPSFCFICKREGLSICNECISKRAISITTPAPYITSIYSFKDPLVKKIIHAGKYNHRKDLLEELTVHAFKKIDFTNKTSYILTPIPMPRLRKYMRGHNQAEIISKKLSEMTGNPIDTGILVRSRTPERQALSHSRRERLENQKNTFAVIKNIRNMNILLIDDVTTTGATLFEARKELLRHGASSVEALTLAH